MKKLNRKKTTTLALLSTLALLTACGNAPTNPGSVIGGVPGAMTAGCVPINANSQNVTISFSTNQVSFNPQDNSITSANMIPVGMGGMIPAMNPAMNPATMGGMGGTANIQKTTVYGDTFVANLQYISNPYNVDMTTGQPRIQQITALSGTITLNQQSSFLYTMKTFLSMSMNPYAGTSAYPGTSTYPGTYPTGMPQGYSQQSCINGVRFRISKGIGSFSNTITAGEVDYYINNQPLSAYGSGMTQIF